MLTAERTLKGSWVQRVLLHPRFNLIVVVLALGVGFVAGRWTR